MEQELFDPLAVLERVRASAATSRDRVGSHGGERTGSRTAVNRINSDSILRLGANPASKSSETGLEVVQNGSSQSNSWKAPKLTTQDRNGFSGRTRMSSSTSEMISARSHSGKTLDLDEVGRLGSQFLENTEDLEEALEFNHRLQQVPAELVDRPVGPATLMSIAELQMELAQAHARLADQEVRLAEASEENKALQTKLHKHLAERSQWHLERRELENLLAETKEQLDDALAQYQQVRGGTPRRSSKIAAKSSSSLSLTSTMPSTTMATKGSSSDRISDRYSIALVERPASSGGRSTASLVQSARPSSSGGRVASRRPTAQSSMSSPLDWASVEVSTMQSETYAPSARSRRRSGFAASAATFRGNNSPQNQSSLSVATTSSGMKIEAARASSPRRIGKQGGLQEQQQRQQENINTQQSWPQTLGQYDQLEEFEAFTDVGNDDGLDPKDIRDGARLTQLGVEAVVSQTCQLFNPERWTPDTFADAFREAPTPASSVSHRMMSKPRRGSSSTGSLKLNGNVGQTFNPFDNPTIAEETSGMFSESPERSKHSGQTSNPFDRSSLAAEEDEPFPSSHRGGPSSESSVGGGVQKHPFIGTVRRGSLFRESVFHVENEHSIAQKQRTTAVLAAAASSSGQSGGASNHSGRANRTKETHRQHRIGSLSSFASAGTWHRRRLEGDQGDTASEIDFLAAFHEESASIENGTPRPSTAGEDSYRSKRSTSSTPRSRNGSGSKPSVRTTIDLTEN